MNKQLSYGGADTLSPMQVLARVRRETGLDLKAVRDITLQEDLVRVKSTGTMIKLVFKVSQYRRTRRGRVQTAEGMRVVSLTRMGERWSVLLDISQLSPVEGAPEEVFRGRVESPDETMERVAHEEMCHRPGTSRFPMDNLRSHLVEDHVNDLINSAHEE